MFRVHPYRSIRLSAVFFSDLIYRTCRVLASGSPAFFRWIGARFAPHSACRLPQGSSLANPLYPMNLSSSNASPLEVTMHSYRMIGPLLPEWLYMRLNLVCGFCRCDPGLTAPVLVHMALSAMQQVPLDMVLLLSAPPASLPAVGGLALDSCLARAHFTEFHGALMAQSHFCFCWTHTYQVDSLFLFFHKEELSSFEYPPAVRYIIPGMFFFFFPSG